MKSIATKDELLLIGLTAIMLLTAILIAYFDHTKNEFYEVINHPTFVGEVVGKESVWHGGFTPSTKSIEHRLHIIGKYYYGDDIIQVDRVFTVSWSQYHQFDIGDLINQ